MRDHRGTDLLARSHLETNRWQACAGNRHHETVPRDSHPANSPFSDCRIAILCPTCSLHLLTSNCVIEVTGRVSLVEGEAWMPFVTVTPHRLLTPMVPQKCPFRSSVKRGFAKDVRVTRKTHRRSAQFIQSCLDPIQAKTDAGSAHSTPDDAPPSAWRAPSCVKVSGSGIFAPI